MELAKECVKWKILFTHEMLGHKGTISHAGKSHAQSE